MVGIPPALDTDSEDVSWALQTAEALWKRNERVDAVVWLRRAAQAAAESEDDDRALALARDAAELTDWMAQNPQPVAAPTRSRPPSKAPTAGEAVDDLLRSTPPSGEIQDRGEGQDRTSIDRVSIELEIEPEVVDPVRAAPAPPRPPPPPPRRAAAPPPPPAPAPEPRFPSPPPPPSRAMTVRPVEPPPGEERASHVPTAAEKHAGMLDPWAEGEAPTQAREPERTVATPPPPPPASARSPAPAPVHPAPETAAAPAPAPAPAREAAPERAPAPSTFDEEEIVTSAPQAGKEVAAPAPAPAPAAVPTPRRATKPPAVAAVQPTATGAIDLSAVEALSDLPDDAREAFARAATVQRLTREEEVSGFALALVLDGQLDLSATIVDAPAKRLETGAVLRARGTIEHVAPVRLVGASEEARVATWDEKAVEEAFRSCPWVEDELRAAGDRLQAEVGLTMGPLGERLDPSLRADVTRRLTLRALAEHEVFATRGEALPGLLVVGVGELELVAADGAPTGEVLRAGEFLFPNEVLRAAPAPRTVRAAKGGALVLFAERGVAQELLVTCPPLLEIFAGA